MNYMAETAYIKGGVLRWARERALLTKAKVADSLGLTEQDIDDWESDHRRFSLAKALDFSKVAHVPFGYLFLSSPPAETLPLPDLRRRKRGPLESPSVNFLDILQEVTLKQQWYRSFAEAAGQASLGFVGKYTTNSKTDEVAGNIRSVLHFTESLRQKSPGPADYLRNIAANAENAGVLVMRSGVVGANNTRPLSTDEFSGFAISDDLAPVIFINVNESNTGQVFTCVHELAHIWLGASGISDNEIPQTSYGIQTDLESFCDAVAAEVLVPRSQFASAWASHTNDVSRVATYFRVSQQVTLRRALDLQVITRDEFFRRWNAIPKPSGVARSSGGNFHNTLPARNSLRFTWTLLGQVREGRVLHRDAARLLGVKPSTLVKIAKMRLGE